MDIRHIYVTDPDRPVLAMIPGFFTQPLAPGVVIDRSWDNSVEALCRDYNLNGCVIRWDSGNVLSLDLNLRGISGLKSIESALSTWQRARASADTMFIEISNYLQSLNSPIYIVGHSLGGRIALRVAQTIPVHKVLALAPAVDIHSVDYPRVADLTAEKPTVFYSARDRVLSTLFTCGQSPAKIIDALRGARVNPSRALRNVASIVESRATSPALGLVGVPPAYNHMFRSIETSHRHAEYANHLGALWRRAS